ncbi:MAG: hypothetical protein ACD_52C00138G0003 [uncultured bacterium]|uniref:Ribbon-helix-helix protein CopG domain-containing protein n=1 Tax=Candidatus Woesebacteria bacterium RIFCSPHIGHO2_12_FULL_41_24 TaxID=1802510 RepID=A0A1F8AU65_9BACT|nr:MAG: hypothetical protein ACD_52C00138G0003 [uncultured bacterium]OGM14592.1 MAG: hypothetical protein A2W15_01360 [Candidatus Woesebacteria bacterium RBG_16_41_13]OGM30418.1 MAG: hypothetical protein A2873_00485 [Candidatus Woesebacteria bacterium RIFCSPHIGHO2_01_FULL_42_80]OGM35464.1 MAG: hypothetical protein A3D84_05800 [Candidatus Woesebacteria bacterium RIFCSPHIGHO2_02_FULL_42_20]OGM55039.1 MAG: hypothetical protein A3E44_04785 [Candidatus Woesebacteria bacterium RIFCSPHIGHO2_12_FULL_41
MISQLTRIQVYVEPKNLAVVDEIAKEIKIKRSQIIRDVVASVVNSYVKTAQLLKIDKINNLKTWLELKGAEESKLKDLGLRVDEIYNATT